MSESKDSLTLETKYESFGAWAVEQGIEVNGIRLAQTHGQGLGIVAERHLKNGEEIIKVPTTALFTTDSIPQDFKDTYKGCTVHGLLASFFTLGESAALGKFDPWRAVWPTMDDFRTSMPVLWLKHVRDSISVQSTPGTKTFYPLPPGIGGAWSNERIGEQQCQELRTSSLLAVQERKLRTDMQTALVKDANSEQRDKFIHNWMIVNTRSFYYDFPLKWKTKSKEDNMILCPFVDYFNHADLGCNVSYDENGYTVTSNRDYERGEELFVSYGQHDTDTLLVEYGFAPAKNKWDSLSLDPLLLAPSAGINLAWRRRLQQHGYLGNYTLSAEGVCYRTIVAVRSQTHTLLQWKRLVAGQTHRMRANSDEIDANLFLCNHVLEPYLAEASNALSLLKPIQAESEDRMKAIMAILTQRWQQIVDLINTAAEGCLNEQAIKQLKLSFEQVR